MTVGIARLKGLQVEEGTICDAPMNPRARVVMFKRRGAQKGSEMSKSVKKQEGAADPLASLGELTDEQKEAITQMLAGKDEQIAQLQQSKAEGEKEPDGDEGDETAKAVAKALAKANTETAELRKALETERNARLDREYLEKARSYAAIPVPPEKVGGLMRIVAEKAADHAPVLEQVLKACDTLARESSVITKSLGVANGITKTGSVVEEVEAEAAKLMSADPKISATKARAEVWKRRPDLLKRHREEVAAR
ncbi:MAG TPA: hypothetical protein VGD74_02295 [Vulgatibacter sp.]